MKIRKQFAEVANVQNLKCDLPNHLWVQLLHLKTIQMWGLTEVANVVRSG